MKLVLNNNKEYDLYEMPSRQSMFINGFTRDTIELHFDKNKYSADEIFDILGNEESTEKFKLIETSIVDGEEVKGNEYIYNNYCIVNEMCLKDVIVEKETPESEEVKEKIISVTLAQLTYTELQYRELMSQVTAQAEILSDLLGGEI